MVKQVPERPPRSCNNYPLCKGLCSRPRVFGRRDSPSVRLLLEYCTNCNAEPACKHEGCSNNSCAHQNKISARGFCANHYNDAAYVRWREWSKCSNSDAGCRELSSTSLGGKCYQCSQNSLPCLFALYGCDKRVRYNEEHVSKTRKGCNVTGHGCNFDPKKQKKCCVPFCSSLRLPGPTCMCKACGDGNIPCQNCFVRTGCSSKAGLCSLCY